VQHQAMGQKMSGLPSPQDIAVKILIWLSAPAVIVMIFTSFLAAAGWLTLGRTSVRYTMIASQRAGETVRHWTSARQRAMVSLLAASTGFVAVSYSLSQLVGVTYEKIGHSHQSIAYGFKFDAGFLVSQLLEYQRWTRLSMWTLVGVLVSIFVLNFANLSGALLLRESIRLIWRIILALGLVASLLLVLDGCSVLVLGVQHHYDNYRPSMALFYAFWVGCLWLLPCFAAVIDGASEKVFSG
jgi:hypothetical protein